MTRKLPMTVKDCIPGDVVVLPSGQGTVVITGDLIGKSKAHRFVRPVDADNKENGELYPISTGLIVVRVIVLCQKSTE